MAEIPDEMGIKGDIKYIGNHSQTLLLLLFYRKAIPTLCPALFNRLDILFNGRIAGIIGKEAAHQSKASLAQISLNGRLRLNILG